MSPTSQTSATKHDRLRRRIWPWTLRRLLFGNRRAFRSETAVSGLSAKSHGDLQRSANCVLWFLHSSVVFLLLCIGGDTAMAGEVWIKSFTGLPGGTAPNGYRYDPNLFGQDIEIGFNYN